MIGDDAHRIAVRDRCFNDHLRSGVHCLDRLDRRLEISRVADHIRIGEIEAHEVILLFGERLGGSAGYSRCAHFRLQIVRGHLRGGHQNPVFSLEGFFAPSTEEIGYVCVFLRFRNA